MLPLLQKEVVENKHWATEEELVDYYAIGQCTPGIIAVNTATFCGHKQAGVRGAAAATLGVITPSILIIGLISAFLAGFSDIPLVRHVFAGLRVCVCVLIANTVAKLWKKSVKGLAGYCLYFAVLLCSLFTSLPAAVLILAAGAVGILLYAIRRGKEKP